MATYAEESLEDKYWIDKGGLRFEFYPYEGKVVTFSEAGLLQAIHHIGMCRVDIDWQTLNGRTFLIKYKPTDDYFTHRMNVSKLVTGMTSIAKEANNALLKNNWDNKTNSSLSIYSVRAAMSRLKKQIKNGERTRSDIPEFFNRFNIEEDEERKRKKADILRLDKRKSANTLIDEGKRALNSLFRKGKLVRLTQEEYEAKMELYE